MKNIFKITFLSLLLSIVFVSCDDDTDLILDNPVLNEFSGAWFIVGLEEDGVTPAYGGDYVKFNIYNTSSNDDGNMWINDNGEFFEIQTKIDTNLSDLSFQSTSDLSNLYDGGTVNISNGKITEGTYTTESGEIVDEIYFEAEFDWDPGYTYVFKGHRRTGFVEDEHPHY